MLLDSQARRYAQRPCELVVFRGNALDRAAFDTAIQLWAQGEEMLDHHWNEQRRLMRQQSG